MDPTPLTSSPGSTGVRLPDVANWDDSPIVPRRVTSDRLASTMTDLLVALLPEFGDSWSSGTGDGSRPDWIGRAISE